MAEEPGLLDKARSFLETARDRIANGGYNWAFALPGMVAGFLLPLWLVNNYTGGGVVSSIIGGLLGFTGAMFGGIMSTQLTHYVADRFTDTVAPEQPRQPERTPTRQRGTEHSANQPRTQVEQVRLEGVESFEPPVTSADLGELTPRSTSMASSGAVLHINIG